METELPLEVLPCMHIHTRQKLACSVWPASIFVDSVFQSWQVIALHLYAENHRKLG